MGAIFINYRRDDTAGEARALYKDLVAALGDGQVFMDVDNLALGMDFRDALDDRLKSCDMMLALVGSGWLDARSESGKRRLDDPGDFVRQEIAAALQRNIPVTPVLVQGARMPTEQQLPKDLQSFAYRNGFELRHQRWDSDVEEMISRFGLSKRTPPGDEPPAATLVAATHAAPARPEPKKKSRLGSVVTIVLIAAAAGAGYWYYTGAGPGGSPVPAEPDDPALEPIELRTGASDLFRVAEPQGVGNFRFTPLTSGLHDISVLSEPASVDQGWEISFDPAFATTLDYCDNDYPERGTESCAVELLTGEQYYLRVSNLTGDQAGEAAQPVDFRITIRPRDLPDDPSEPQPGSIDPGPTRPSVTLGTGMSERFAADDEDGLRYFLYTPEATTIYAISVVSEPASVDHSWRISTDPAFATTIEDCDGDVPEAGTETCSVALMAGQEYHLAVENRAGEPAVFTIAIEPPVVLGPGRSEWFSIRDADGSGYFRFTPDTTGFYEIALMSEPASVDHSWSVSEDPTFETTFYDCDADIPEAGTETCAAALTAGLEYHLAVENRAGEPADFTLEIEPPLALGTGQSGWFSIRNADGLGYFRFSPAETAVYEIAVMSEPASVDHSWSLSEDPAFGSTIEDCDYDEPQPGSETCAIALTTGRDYHLAVENRDGEPADFTITITPMQ